VPVSLSPTDDPPQFPACAKSAAASVCAIDRGSNMNNKILSGRATGRMTCAWIATDDLRNPLVRVWSEVSPMCEVAKAPSFSHVAEAGLLLCA
jgi:hypothetical protein